MPISVINFQDTYLPNINIKPLPHAHRPFTATRDFSIMASLLIPHPAPFASKDSALGNIADGSAIRCKCGYRISGNSNIGFDLLAVDAKRSRRKLGQKPMSASWTERAYAQAVPHSRSTVSRRDFGSAVKAVAVEGPAVAPAAEGDDKIEYDWRTEWYPLYLTAEIPRDAPLALNVYDHNLVLFYDGEGKLNCLEDQCPHRFLSLQIFLS